MKWLVVVALVAIVGSGVTFAQNYPPGVTVVKVYAQPASSPCGAQGGESAAIAAGALTVTTGNAAPQALPCQTVPAPTGSTYGFQNQASAPACQPPPAPKEKVIVVEKRKRCHWWNPFTWGCGASATVVVDGGFPPAYNYGSYWVPNTPAYDDYYYGGHNRVFSWGYPSYPSYSTSYHFVDNYRSGPYPPVRFVPDAPRGHPSTPYHPYGGGGGSRSPGPRPSPPPPRGGGGHR